jgi:uncharacterized protein (TIGR00255 family)
MVGMTGYSSISKDTKLGRISMSLRSLNSRFLEIKINMPSNLIAGGLGDFEKVARDMIKSNIRRGKIDVFIDFSIKGQDSTTVELNEELAKLYFSSIKNLSLSLGLLPDIEIKDIIALPGVMKVSNTQRNYPTLGELKKMFSKLLNDVVKQRVEEGKRIKEDVDKLISEILASIDEISSKVDVLNSEIEKKVFDRVSRYLGDPKNLEIGISTISFLMKIDINEELVRLRMHTESLKALINSDDEVGKKGEFILQEMMRESNTIAAKSFSYDISNLVVGIKTNIEKIREHLQNVE